MKWFINCKTVEEAKALYKDLAKKYHPDIAGPEHTTTMQEINKEFEDVYNYLKANPKSNTETPKEFMDIIDKLIMCEGVIIDLDDPQGKDDESGLSHLSHLACNIAFLCELEKLKKKV